MSVFGVILVRIQFECGKIQTRITPNTLAMITLVIESSLRLVRVVRFLFWGYRINVVIKTLNYNMLEPGKWMLLQGKKTYSLINKSQRKHEFAPWNSTERRIQSPVKHLKWSVMQKQLTAFGCLAEFLIRLCLVLTKFKIPMTRIYLLRIQWYTCIQWYT